MAPAVGRRQDLVSSWERHAELVSYSLFVGQGARWEEIAGEETTNGLSPELVNQGRGLKTRDIHVG